MLRGDDVKKYIGNENHELILNEIDNGSLDKDNIQKLGIKLDQRLNGVFNEENSRGKNLTVIWEKMLDRLMTTNPKEDGPTMLKKAFTEMSREDLAMKLVLNNGSLESSMPSSHPEIPDLILQQNKTSAPPVPDQQGNRNTCASHAIAKAIQAFYDKNGYETEQTAIRTALVKHVQPDWKAKNPDEFDGKKIKVAHLKNGKQGEDTIEVNVATWWGNVDENDMTFKTKPIDGMQGWEMVLRWDIGILKQESSGTTLQKFQGPHAIYSGSYDKIGMVYNCINSWGDLMLPKPKIHISRIYAIDYISICKVNK